MRWLRVAFYLLIFGNLLLFAYAQGYLGPAGGGEAERLAGQLQPEKIRIVGKGAPPGPEAPAPEACRALAGLPGEQMQRLAEWLRGRDGQLKLSQRAAEEPKSWWVFIPPRSDKRDAEKTAAELKKLGVGDFFIVQEKGPSQFALSLGLFKSEQGAKEYLGKLGKKGVRSARIQAREAATDKMAVEVRGAPDRLAKALSDLPAEFAGAAQTECAAGK